MFHLGAPGACSWTIPSAPPPSLPSTRQLLTISFYFSGGVSLTGLPATSFPLAVICGLLCGCLVGYIIYKYVLSPAYEAIWNLQAYQSLTRYGLRGSHASSMQIFLIISTCFLYLIAAGLLSKAVWYFENYKWGLVIGGDASETGSGPGSYDIDQSVWHVNCCNPELDGGVSLQLPPLFYTATIHSGG